MPARIYLPAKQSKYRAKPVKVDGIRFDSQKEANRYGELKLLNAAKKVTIGGYHPRWRLEVNGVHICDYVADFQYLNLATQKVVVEDVKGVRTPAYRLKKKLMLAIHGIEIQEV